MLFYSKPTRTHNTYAEDTSSICADQAPLIKLYADDDDDDILVIYGVYSKFCICKYDMCICALRTTSHMWCNSYDSKFPTFLQIAPDTHTHTQKPHNTTFQFAFGRRAQCDVWRIITIPSPTKHLVWCNCASQ